MRTLSKHARKKTPAQIAAGFWKRGDGRRRGQWGTERVYFNDAEAGDTRNRQRSTPARGDAREQRRG